MFFPLRKWSMREEACHLNHAICSTCNMYVTVSKPVHEKITKNEHGVFITHHRKILNNKRKRPIFKPL